MTNSLQITFFGHIPSKKNSRQVGRNNIPLPSKAFQRWHKAELATLHDAPHIPSPVAITYEFWIGGKNSPREFDLSNSEESINDLLVDAGIVEDDSWLHLVERHSKIGGFVRGEGRCVVTLEHSPVMWREPVLTLKDDGAIRKLKDLSGQPMTAIRSGEWAKITGNP